MTPAEDTPTDALSLTAGFLYYVQDELRGSF